MSKLDEAESVGRGFSRVGDSRPAADVGDYPAVLLLKEMFVLLGSAVEGEDPDRAVQVLEPSQLLK